MKSGFLVSLIFLPFSLFAVDKTRHISLPVFCGYNSALFISLSNPSDSGADAKVSVDFNVTSSSVPMPSPPALWLYKERTVGASDATQFDAGAKPTHAVANNGGVALKPGASFQASVGISGAGLDASGNWACALKISITSDNGRGYVTAAGGLTAVGPSAVPSPLIINGGRPF